MVLVGAAGQHATLFIEVEAEKEGHRVSVYGRAIEDTVDGRFESFWIMSVSDRFRLDNGKSVKVTGHLRVA